MKKFVDSFNYFTESRRLAAVQIVVGIINVALWIAKFTNNEELMSYTKPVGILIIVTVVVSVLFAVFQIIKGIRDKNWWEIAAAISSPLSILPFAGVIMVIVNVLIYFKKVPTPPDHVMVKKHPENEDKPER